MMWDLDLTKQSCVQYESVYTCKDHVHNDVFSFGDRRIGTASCSATNLVILTVHAG